MRARRAEPRRLFDHRFDAATIDVRKEQLAAQRSATMPWSVERTKSTASVPVATPTTYCAMQSSTEGVGGVVKHATTPRSTQAVTHPKSGEENKCLQRLGCRNTHDWVFLKIDWVFFFQTPSRNSRLGKFLAPFTHFKLESVAFG
jgi:hypothetical protein